MYKNFVSAACGCLFFVGALAQNMEIDQVIQAIEHNNHSLKAQRAFIQSAELELSSTNNLPDPQVDAFYLPFGNHMPGDYTEIQFSQTVEFPTVYTSRGQLIKRKKELLQKEYNKYRQQVLLEAKNLCLQLIYLRKMERLEKERLQQAQKVFEQVETLYQQEQVGALELNKAKVHWLQAQFVLDQVKSEIEGNLLQLKGMNGDIFIDFKSDDYEMSLTISTSDSLWNDRLNNDPVLASYRSKEAVSSQQINLTRNQNLPNLTAGYNRQGVAGSVYSGIYGGLSIPLWGNRNQVKAAKARLQFEQLNAVADKTEFHAELLTQHQRYLIQLKNFKTFDMTLNSLQSEGMLLQAYQLGEISFIKLYNELRFYREAYDRLLRIEKELHQQKAELLKHQL